MNKEPLNPLSTKKWHLGVLLMVWASISSCSQQKEELLAETHKPFLMRAANGEVKSLTLEEAQDLCVQNFCEENQIYHIDSVHEAPLSQELDYAKNLMEVPEAWKVSKGSKKIIVATIDSGVDLNHSELKESYLVNLIEQNGKPGVDDDQDGYTDNVIGFDFYRNRPLEYDLSGHGTHIAGIIGAKDNQSGVVGVAPQVQILPLRFIDADGNGTTERAIKAIHYAVEHGAHVISNSWGGGAYSKLLGDAIQYARSKGVIVVASAGNKSKNIDYRRSYPASYEGVIAVGSSDERDRRSGSSNYGKKSVKFFAPGSNIKSTYPRGRFKEMSGTSMAAPQVSALIALALSVNPNLKEEQLTKLICESSEPILLQYSQCGRINARKLMERLRN